jgi:hypothetical protein
MQSQRAVTQQKTYYSGVISGIPLWYENKLRQIKCTKWNRNVIRSMARWRLGAWKVGGRGR